MEEILIDVESCTAVKAFLPFTALPERFAGKTVMIVLCDEQSIEEPESMELPF